MHKLQALYAREQLHRTTDLNGAQHPTQPLDGYEHVGAASQLVDYIDA